MLGHHPRRQGRQGQLENIDLAGDIQLLGKAWAQGSNGPHHRASPLHEGPPGGMERSMLARLKGEAIAIKGQPEQGFHPPLGIEEIQGVAPSAPLLRHPGPGQKPRYPLRFHHGAVLTGLEAGADFEELGAQGLAVTIVLPGFDEPRKEGRAQHGQLRGKGIGQGKQAHARAEGFRPGAINKAVGNDFLAPEPKERRGEGRSRHHSVVFPRKGQAAGGRATSRLS